MIHKNNSCPPSVLIWDSSELPPSFDGKIILWNQFNHASNLNYISLPDVVENESDYFREQYLSWVYEFGNLKINNTNLINSLKIRSDFSYWWMTLISEKCNWEKSPKIYDAIRMIALNDWLINNDISSVDLVSSSKKLSKSIQTLGIEISNETQLPLPPLNTTSLIKRAYENMPLIFQGIIWYLKHIFERWTLRGVGLSEWKLTDGRTVFFSHLRNGPTNDDDHSQDQFWGPLIPLLRKEKRITNWCYLFSKSDQLPDSKTAANTLNISNKKGQLLNAHASLDTFINFKLIIKTFADWISLIFLAKTVKRNISFVRPIDLSIWLLLENDWNESMYGSVGIQNVLYLNLIESALSLAPKQDFGLYLKENQCWEYALIYAWQSSNHGKLIGVNHSTIRYWDLRFFFDPRTFNADELSKFPVPSITACNGPVMLENLINSGHPKNQLCKAEPLRFFDSQHTVQLNDKLDKASRLIVIGDYAPTVMFNQMNLLAEAAPYFPADLEIIVKPHPGSLFSFEDYPDLNLTFSHKPLSKLLRASDLVYSGSNTSAVVDVFLIGVPMCIYIEPTSLNMSPLRGFESIHNIFSAKELIHFVYSDRLVDNSDSQKFFYDFDQELKCWKKLLQ